MVKQLLATFMLLATALVAADVTGKWSAQVPGRGGEMREQIYNLKAEGATLTGTVEGMGEPAPISNGKVEGDKVSFTMTREFNGNTITWNFAGTVSAEEMKLTRSGGRGEPREIVAKRVK